MTDYENAAQPGDAANGGIALPLQSTRLVAAVAELESLDRMLPPI